MSGELDEPQLLISSETKTTHAQATCHERREPARLFIQGL
jgi:hypothetical protein